MFTVKSINESRFATRAWACGERVRYLINDFPKIVDKIPDDRGRNRGKPGAGRSTRRTASKSKSLGFSKKRRESCGGPELIDSSPMMAFEERHLGRDRFLYNSYQFGNSFS